MRQDAVVEFLRQPEVPKRQVTRGAGRRTGELCLPLLKGIRVVGS